MCSSMCYHQDHCVTCVPACITTRIAVLHVFLHVLPPGSLCYMCSCMYYHQDHCVICVLACVLPSGQVYYMCPHLYILTRVNMLCLSALAYSCENKDVSPCPYVFASTNVMLLYSHKQHVNT
ncbi:hypothetical protein OTU49_013522 [Cherax quadricarinatus]|uniref:Uncharacterized protein n=1 Tax=Cherax quadricarinatus TaxID=27406 RepID=A0AAW0VUM3_CHEQU